MNGTVEGLAILCNDLDNFLEDQLVLLLPVFFNCIDPSLIPVGHLLDENGQTAQICIMRALLSLTALATITENSSFPLDAAPDLWSRTWPWIHFFHTHWGCLPGIPLSDEAGVYEHMSLLVTNLNRHSGAAVAIVRARGVRTILAKTWASMTIPLVRTSSRRTI
jgi:hypothetical protein